MRRIFRTPGVAINFNYLISSNLRFVTITIIIKITTYYISPLSDVVFQARQRAHQFREVLAAGQTGDGVHYVETGGVPVRKERQSRAVPAHHTGAQRKRLIFLCCNLAFPSRRYAQPK